MTIGPQEIVRSEMEGGLSGPANPIPSQSIDCGCKQLRCPKLARFATRNLFVTVVCCIGLIQAAAFSYLYVTSSTIARRFQFDPSVMEWVLISSLASPFVFGLIIAYWGDRIHRLAWTGSLALLQSAGYFVLMVPHFTHTVRVIEETNNATHMSMYSEDSPELCAPGLARIILEEAEPCYTTLALLVVVQFVAGMAHIAYCSLAISYLDDNTRKKHVAVFIGLIITVKIFGLLFGYFLAWGCLSINAETLRPVESYREEIGAWWLGFPIIGLLLAIPALLLSLFPRRLPSEVVSEAAASILDSASHSIQTLERTNREAGSPDFWPSLVRLFCNHTLTYILLSSVFCVTALINFAHKENIILESRFHIPRPTGMLLGFGDPYSSRVISTILKPVVIGLIIIISGLVIARAKPSARFLVGYNFLAILLTAVIIFSLSFSSCETPQIVGRRRGSISLLRYCNKDCRCSKDADFRPLCDTNGKFTFYSPCHAGCKMVDFLDGRKMFKQCSCVEEITGLGNTQAIDGACGGSDCQVGWLAFEFGTMLGYSIIASTLIGNLLIILRSVNLQDKALAIGYWMGWLAIFVNLPGKLLYDFISSMTCQHWGNEKAICHLHHSRHLQNYLSYLTSSMLLVAALFQFLVWLFIRDLKMYESEEVLQNVRELQVLVQRPDNIEEAKDGDNDGVIPDVEEIASDEQPATTTAEISELPAQNQDATQHKEEEELQTSSRLKYGPLGPGDRRNERPTVKNIQSEDEHSSSDESSVFRTDKSPKFGYIPLELDSDVESDLSSTGPRTRKRVLSKDFDAKPRVPTISRRPFPNPDHYQLPKAPNDSSCSSLDSRHNETKARESFGNGAKDGFSTTNSFVYTKKGDDDDVPQKGDFNEIGIPIVEDYASTVLKNRVHFENLYTKNKSTDNLAGKRDGKEDNNECQRPSSREQSSSGFGSLPDIQDRIVSPSIENSKENLSSQKMEKAAPICTDL